jgi:hypothetical protein
MAPRSVQTFVWREDGGHFAFRLWFFPVLAIGVNYFVELRGIKHDLGIKLPTTKFFERHEACVANVLQHVFVK